MSLTEFALQRRTVTGTLIVVLIFAGISAYGDSPRQMDPGFIIRTAMITTYFPGASPERVEQLITDPIEKAVQEIPELDWVNSESRTGVSVIYVNIREEFKEMRPIWTISEERSTQSNLIFPKASTARTSTTSSGTCTRSCSA